MKPFVPDDLLLYRSVGEIDCVQSSEYAACSVKTPDRESDGYHSAIWLVPLKDGAPVQFTSGTSTDNYPKWSPDGSQLAFVSSRAGGLPQVHIIDINGGEAHCLTHMKQGVVALEWAPDGKRLLVTAPIKVDPAARGERSGSPKEGAPQLVWRLPYKSDGLGFVLDREIHLFIVDVADGSSIQITDAPFDVRSTSWSPDGKRIAYTRTRTGREAHRVDVWVTDADGNNAHRLSESVATTQYPVWSPDGRWIVFTGSEDEGDSQQRLWKIDMRDESVSQLGDVSIEVESGDSVKWSPDSKSVFFVQVHRGVKRISSIDVPSGKLSTLVEGERHVLKLALAGDRLVYAAAAVASPGEVYACNLDGTGEKKLTNFNAWWSDRAAPRVSLRRFDVPDGDGGTETIEGWLLLPSTGGDGPFPLLVDAHGGPQSVAFVEFDKHVYRHVLCSQGWAVLALNPVGSSSYGTDFARRLRGRWGKLDFPQHLAAVEQLQRERVADERLAITGKSYGGYLTAWAISRSQLFKAAVVSAPVSNIESHFGTSDTGYYVTPYSLRGEPYIKRETARELCPMDRMQEATTPTLILQGTDDCRCPVGQSEEIFATIMRSGDTPVEMVLYPGGDHHVAEQGKPSFRIDYVTRIVEWVERWTQRQSDTRHTDDEAATSSSSNMEERERSAA